MPQTRPSSSLHPRVPTIAIMGVPVSSGNRGVLALGASLVDLCGRAAPGAHLVLLIGNRDRQPATFRVNGELRQIPVVNHRLSPRSAPGEHLVGILVGAILHRLLPFRSFRGWLTRSNRWIGTVASADFVGDVHGGDSFSDIYGLKGLTFTFVTDFCVWLVKGSIVQFPQTYGPYKHPLARCMARFLLRRSSVIIARDKKSRAIAQELAGPNKTVLLSPDVAFSLESIRLREIRMAPPLSPAGAKNIIGLNVNGLMYNGGYTGRNMFGLKLDYASFLPVLVTALLQNHPNEVWLVPHTFAPNGDVESDPEASHKLRDSLPAGLRTRVRIVDQEYDQYEIKGVISQCDFFIGSRMHACIAALSQGVPCVGVAYSMKFAGVFESVGMESWVVDARDATNEEAVARILELYLQREDVRATLKQHADAARAQLRGVFETLIATCAGKPAVS
ncbi:MAG: hypothetical protein JWM88_1887 [Verrucomicrobia bacterium]|nr:hypothetical protein [Verrucomicrobiota bacterium]